MMLTRIRNISITLLVSVALSGCGGGKPKEYLEPHQLTSPKGKVEGEPVKVAFLLPLTGQYSQLGKAMQDAAQLALFDSNVENLELVPIDTQDSGFAASKAAQEAINDGAKLILGPVFSAVTEKVAPIAAQKQVNVISLSNDWSLAGKPGVFLLGYTPQQQIQRVTQYAADRGLKDFSALVPNNAYGVMAVGEYQKVINRNQGTLHKTEYYVPSPQALRLGLKQQAEGIRASLPAKESTGKSAAVLVPEGGERLGKIASWLSDPEKGMQVQLLGSSQWDDDKVLKTPELQGGWYAGTDPALHQSFNQRFYEVYGYVPPRIVSLAYDAAALAANLAAQGDFSKKSLTTPRGFAGVDGAFRFRNDGVSERGLAILQVDNGTARVIDPAPVRFVNN